MMADGILVEIKSWFIYDINPKLNEEKFKAADEQCGKIHVYFCNDKKVLEIREYVKNEKYYNLIYDIDSFSI